ncbi:MAG: hypothetical protein Q8M26_14430 [Pseudolabrys sp.]|nr:hypothetical protein [Pseudolabrys sp.]
MRTTTLADAQRSVSKSVRPSKGARRRSTSVRAVELSAVPPLHWWRHLPSDAYTVAHLEILHRAISGITFLNEPRWPDAVRGEPAAAIGIALRTARRHSTSCPVVDLVMSAVLLTALAGDPAARLMLTTMIDRHRTQGQKRRLLSSLSSRTQSITGALAIVETSGPHVSRSKNAGA